MSDKDVCSREYSSLDSFDDDFVIPTSRHPHIEHLENLLEKDDLEGVITVLQQIISLD